MDIAVEIGRYKSCLELTSCPLRLHNIQIFGFGKSSARKEEGSPPTMEILKGKSLSTESGHLVELIQSGPLPGALNLEETGCRGTTQCLYQSGSCLPAFSKVALQYPPANSFFVEIKYINFCYF